MYRDRVKIILKGIVHYDLRLTAKPPTGRKQNKQLSSPGQKNSKVEAPEVFRDVGVSGVRE